MSLNITSLNLLRNFLGVVLYPWEARVFTGDDIAGFAYEKTYYQVLVDNRDADELPMELETLRISEDTTRNPSDVKVSFISFNLIRFQRWVGFRFIFFRELPLGSLTPLHRHHIFTLTPVHLHTKSPLFRPIVTLGWVLSMTNKMPPRFRMTVELVEFQKRLDWVGIRRIGVRVNWSESKMG